MMSNSRQVGFINYGGNVPFPIHAKLGRSIIISLADTHKESALSYTINMTPDSRFWRTYKACKLTSTKYVDNDGKLYKVNFRLDESEFITKWSDFSFRIEVKGSNSLRLHKPENFPSIILVFTNKIVGGRSATVDQVIYLYGNDEDNRGGLLVTECKENEVTVVHYFVICRERFNFNFISETDIGLSVVAKFKASNGSLDVTVEGPDAHPPSALVYMFDVVKKTRTWNPSMCPHCGDNNGDSNSHGSQSIVVINNNGNSDGYGHGSYIENIRFH